MDDTVISDPLRFGDHLRVKRRFYMHHGIYVGNNQVIQYAPPPGKEVADGIGWRQVLGADSPVNTIHTATLKAFEHEGIRASVVPYDNLNCYPPLKTVSRAQSRIGENGYNLWGNNCEQFTHWCKKVQPQGDPVNLWESTWEGALLGFSAGSRARQWSTMVLGAGIGALLGATKQWLQSRTLAGASAEFTAFSSALYFSLAENHKRYPFGYSFRHASQISRLADNATAGDDDIVFLYCGGFFNHSSRNDWWLTEQAIVCTAPHRVIEFHDIKSIRAFVGSILITTLEGDRTRLSCRFIKAGKLATFLTSAIAGTHFALTGNAKTMFGRVKDAILGPRAKI